MFAEIVPGIYSVEHRVAEGKNGVIIGSRGAVALDTGSDAEEGQAMVDLLRVQGWPPDCLVLSHGHGDHILGSSVFKGADVFAHTLTPAVMRKHLPQLAAGRGLPVEDLAAELAWPTITFSEDLWMDLGGRTVHLFPAPGHSDDGICAYIPEERLLFGSDAVVTGIVPAIADGDSRQLEASLQRLAALEIEVLVPGHGPVLQGQARVQAWLAWLIAYLSEIRQFVREQLAQGQAPAAIETMATFERFVGDRLPADRHGMPRRHRTTVGKIITEETARR